MSFELHEFVKPKICKAEMKQADIAHVPP